MPSGYATGYTTGSEVTLPTPTKVGYTFAGWYIDSSFTDPSVPKIRTTDSGDKIFWAKWTKDPVTPATYTITFNLNGASALTSPPANYQAGDEVTLPIPTRAGYKFLGWYDNPGFTGTAVQAIGADATGNKTFFAKWNPNTYNFFDDLSGGGKPAASPTVIKPKTRTISETSDEPVLASDIADEPSLISETIDEPDLGAKADDQPAITSETPGESGVSGTAITFAVVVLLGLAALAVAILRRRGAK